MRKPKEIYVIYRAYNISKFNFNLNLYAIRGGQ